MDTPHPPKHFLVLSPTIRLHYIPAPAFSQLCTSLSSSSTDCPRASRRRSCENILGVISILTSPLRSVLDSRHPPFSLFPNVSSKTKLSIAPRYFRLLVVREDDIQDEARRRAEQPPPQACNDIEEAMLIPGLGRKYEDGDTSDYIIGSVSSRSRSSTWEASSTALERKTRTSTGLSPSHCPRNANPQGAHAA